MPIIQPPIFVNDDIYIDYLTGKTNIKGLAIDKNTNRIIKHLDTVPDDYEVDENDEDSSAIIGGILVTAAIIAITGITIHIISKKNKQKIEAFKDNLLTYISAAKEQRLTLEIIDNLISSMDSLKKSARKRINIGFTTDELSALVDYLCNHTHNLAQANGIDVGVETDTDNQPDVFSKLHKTLIIQRDIFSQAA